MTTTRKGHSMSSGSMHKGGTPGSMGSGSMGSGSMGSGSLGSGSTVSGSTSGGARVIGTGGYAATIARETDVFDAVNINLTLLGLRLVHELNRA